MGGRGDVGDVEGLDVGGVVEHRAELLGEEVELRLRDREAGQRGHVGDVVTGQAGSHGPAS